MAGFTAENQMSGLMKVAAWDALDAPDVQVVDVREADEVLALELPGAINIPLGQLRARVAELDPAKPTITSCAVGVRAYNAARILSQAGFADVAVYPAGARFWHSTHTDAAARTKELEAAPFAESAAAPAAAAPAAADGAREVSVNCCGMQCPGPIMAVSSNLKEMQPGELLRVSASDPGFARDIGSWCRRTGNTLVSNTREGAAYVACVRKGEGSAPNAVRADHAHSERDGKTLVVFSGDMDKVMASFIIANGAAAMGRPVTMFFTFWGLNALRKPGKVAVAKSGIEKMFGAMMPRGAERLGTSKMNFGGLGAAMMKKIMADKNVTSLPELIQCAMNSGVKIIACTMSMDVMGIKPEELIDGIEFAGVGTYLGDAEESDVNLFI